VLNWCKDQNWRCLLG